MKQTLRFALTLGLLTCSTVFGQVPSYVPTTGLVGYWPFNGNANDESGNGNNGTVNGATLANDRFGGSNKAYNFDGVNDDIQIQSVQSLNLINDFSISSWFLADTIYDVPGTIKMILTKHRNGITTDGWVYGIWNNSNSNISSGTINFQGSPNYTNQSYPTNNGGDVFINEWYNFTVTYSSNQSVLKYYLNGTLVSILSINFDIVANNQDVLIGAEFQISGFNKKNYFNGKLDDIAIYDRILTQQEITALYQGCNINPNTTPITALTNTGANTQFTASSISGASYEWQSNHADFGWTAVPNNNTYSGNSSNSLTISNVQLANHQQPFRVIVTSGNCKDTSEVSYIQVADTCITHVNDTLYTTVTDTLIIETTLGFNNTLHNTIKIYPNPASDYITIDNGNYAAMAGYSLTIKNNAGQVVFQSVINQAQFTVDLSTWSGNGLYFVHLLDNQNNTVTVRKIVLN